MFHFLRYMTLENCEKKTKPSPQTTLIAYSEIKILLKSAIFQLILGLCKSHMSLHACGTNTITASYSGNLARRAFWLAWVALLHPFYFFILYKANLG